MAMDGCGAPMGSVYKKQARFTEDMLPRFLAPATALFLWEGKKSELDKRKLKGYTTRFMDCGGWMTTEVVDETTHIISNDYAACLSYCWDVKKCPYTLSKKVKIVSYFWLAACLKVRTMVLEKFFRIDLDAQPGCPRGNFCRACGEIDLVTGKWYYVSELGEAVKREGPAVNPEEKGKAKVVEDGKDSKEKGKAIEDDLKDSAGPIFDMPPWITFPERRASMCASHEVIQFPRTSQL